MKTSAQTRRDHIVQTTLYAIYTFKHPDENSALAHKRWALTTTTENLMKALDIAGGLSHHPDIARVEIKKRWHCQAANSFQEETVRIFDQTSRGLRGFAQTLIFWFRQMIAI